MSPNEIIVVAIELSLGIIAVGVSVLVLLQAMQVKEDIEDTCERLARRAKRLERVTNDFQKTVKIEVSKSVLDYLTEDKER